MVMRKAGPETDQISRSILQKAIRRGDLELTKKAINFIIQDNDFDWMRKRLAVMTFEECWTYGLEVSYEKNEEIISNHYLKLVSTIKNKNAAGLGSLAYVLSEGDESVFNNNTGDRAIRIIAEAIKRPKDFWEWVHSQAKEDKQKLLVENADKGFRKAGWPWDRAFAQAAAYLSVTDEIPETVYVESKSDSSFPFWVGIDKHTREGKVAIREAAKRKGINANKALWLAFYFESAKCNQIIKSPWWDREIYWRMQKLDLDIDKGRRMWEELKPIVIELLIDEEYKLKDKLFSIKNIIVKEKPIQPSLF